MNPSRVGAYSPARHSLVVDCHSPAPQAPGSPRSLDRLRLAALLTRPRSTRPRCGACVVSPDRATGPFRTPTPWIRRPVVERGADGSRRAPESVLAPVRSTPGVGAGWSAGPGAHHGRRSTSTRLGSRLHRPDPERPPGPSAGRRRSIVKPPRPGGPGTGPRSREPRRTNDHSASERSERARGPQRATGSEGLRPSGSRA
jgi:hypothetical protein